MESLSCFAMGCDALERLVAIEKSLHVAGLHDVETPHLDFFHHAREHAMLVAGVAGDDDTLFRRGIAQKIAEDSVDLGVHEHAMRLALDGRGAVVVGGDDGVGRLDKDIARNVGVLQRGHAVLEDIGGLAVDFRAFFRSLLVVIRHERKPHAGGLADLVGDAQTHGSEADKSNMDRASFFFALFEFTEHSKRFDL